MCPTRGGWWICVGKTIGWIDGQAQYKKLLESLHGQRSDIGEQESQGVISPKKQKNEEPSFEAAKQKVTPLKRRDIPSFFC